MSKKIAIIGGGAAGFFAAINAKQNNANTEVIIFEGSKKVLAKVLVSGGGRCNVTNNTLNPKDLVNKYPRGKRELLGPFNYFGPKDTIEWFESRGVKLKVEADNRIFPISDLSETIAECLKSEAKKLGVILKLDLKLIHILKNNEADKKFELTFSNSHKDLFESVILATGGVTKGYELASSLGHQIIKPVPSLFTFQISNPLLENLSGLSFKHVAVNLKIADLAFKNQGPLLITHWGLSGPAVIVLSAICARELNESGYKADLKINFFPGLSQANFSDLLISQKMISPKKTLYNSNPLDLPNAFWQRILNVLDISNTLIWADLSKKSIRDIIELVTNAQFKVMGKGQFKEEFVTAGGVKLDEVDFRTMESKLCPGLYFAGEILDVDGVTGGFNFQAAWTTGFIAGGSAA